MSGSTDHAVVVRIASIRSELLSRKLRVAGRVQAYDSMKGTVTLCDGETDDELLVDISLCFSPFQTYPWLEEQNTAVMVVGYLEQNDSKPSLSDAPSTILRAILLKERSELDLKLWNRAITSYPSLTATYSK